MSSTDHPCALPKSHSSHTNPLGKPQLSNQQLIGTQSGSIEPLQESGLTQNHLHSEEPATMVNQAYYTYDDPDFNSSGPLDEQEEYVI